MDDKSTVTLCSVFFSYRANGGVEDSTVVTGAVEATKERDNEAIVLGSALREVRPRFTWLFQNMASMKDTGKKKKKHDHALEL